MGKIKSIKMKYYKQIIIIFNYIYYNNIKYLLKYEIINATINLYQTNKKQLGNKKEWNGKI